MALCVQTTNEKTREGEMERMKNNFLLFKRIFLKQKKKGASNFNSVLVSEGKTIRYHCQCWIISVFFLFCFVFLKKN